MKTSILFLLISTCCLSQTKIIAYKSHSGSDANISAAFENNLFDINESNFGDIPYQRVRSASLDTLIYVSDTEAIMVTSSYCENVDYGDNRIRSSDIWNAGRKTVYNPLFGKKHSLDSIKQILGTDYYFKNKIENVVFIGYDNANALPPKKAKTRKKSILPLNFIDTTIPPKFFFFIIISALSLAIGYFSYNINKYGVLITGK